MNQRLLFTDGNTTDIVENKDGLVQVITGPGYSNLGETRCELRETGNGFIAFFPSNNCTVQDYYICMDYGQARDLVLSLSLFQKELGFT